MLIIAGKMYVAPEDREELLAGFDKIIRSARAKPECLDFVVSADPIEEGRVNLFERWESEEALKAHQATTAPPAPEIEMLDVDVRVYQVTPAEG